MALEKDKSTGNASINLETIYDMLGSAAALFFEQGSVSRVGDLSILPEDLQYG